jgi:hypothetical protein
MLRIIVILTLVFSSTMNYAKSGSFYQVDLIVFTHASKQSENSVSSSLNLKNAHTLSLKSASKNPGPFQILPTSASKLRSEFWDLNRKPQYRVLLNYSWKQPKNNQNAVLLPAVDKDGWHVDGILRIKKDQYYLVDAEINFLPNNSSHAPFTMIQSKRLKEGVVYYLDHPHAGFLIKIHNIS